MEYLFTVEPGVFNPPPKVRSAVIRLTRNQTQGLDCDEQLFRRVVKTTFNQRRNTPRTNIRPLLTDGSFDQTAVDQLLAQPVFNMRPEQLSVADFVELTQQVSLTLKKY